jgi:GntR family transcriptional regulator
MARPTQPGRTHARPVIVDGPVPKHLQLRRILEEQIHSGGRLNDVLPSERELMLTYDVGRSTVREAMEALVRRGLAYRVQGKGTYIKALKPVAGAELKTPDTRRRPVMLSFTQELVDRGLKASTAVLKVEEILNPEVADRLEVPPGTPLLQYSRVRLGNGQPMAIQNSYLVAERLTEQAVADLHAGAPLSDVLHDLGIRPTTAVESYSAINLTAPASCAALHLKPGSAVFSVDRRTFGEDGKVCEYVTSILRGAMYTLELQLGTAQEPSSGNP